MKYIVRSLIVAFFVLGYKSVSKAQQVNVPYESSKIQLAYKNAPYLFFDMKSIYRYENNLSEIVDSSSGQFRISGTRYWGKINDDEYMQNDTFLISVDHSGKIMQLLAAKEMYPKIANITFIDSLLKQYGGTIEAGAAGGGKYIEISFPVNEVTPYKTFRITYDATSYLIKQIDYIVLEEFLGNGTMEELKTATPSYFRITTTYTYNQTSDYDISYFNSVNYFFFSDNKYIPSLKLNGYEIFVASPELFK